MQGVNDAGAASRRNAGNRLRVFSAWVSPRLRFEKKPAEQFSGFRGVTILAGDFVRGSQRRDGVAQLRHAATMLDKIFGVCLAVALNVGEAVRGVWIRPPVIAIRIKIIWPAFAEFGLELRESDGFE